MSASKSYSVRVAESAPELTSEHVSAWLDEQLTSRGPLTPDPGAGDKTLRLALPREKVEQAAKTAGENDASFLRRLVATRAGLKPEERPESKEEKPRVKEMEVPRALRLQAEQLRPAVAAYDTTQAWLISMAMRAPEAKAAARFTPEEREQLAGATVEVLNRRASAWPWLVQNLDLVNFGLLLTSIELQKIDAAAEVAKRLRAARGEQPARAAAMRQAERQNGQPADLKPKARPVGDLCAARECGEPAVPGVGYCRMHRQEAEAAGD